MVNVLVRRVTYFAVVSFKSVAGRRISFDFYSSSVQRYDYECSAETEGLSRCFSRAEDDRVDGFIAVPGGDTDCYLGGVIT